SWSLTSVLAGTSSLTGKKAGCTPRSPEDFCSVPWLVVVKALLLSAAGDPVVCGAGSGSEGGSVKAVTSGSPIAADCSRILLTSTTPTRHKNEHDTTRPALVSRVILPSSVRSAGAPLLAWRSAPAGSGAALPRSP